MLIASVTTRRARHPGAQPATATPKLLRWANTILCLGLNLVIARLGLDPRWRYLVWALIAANELRGLYVAWSVGRALL